MSNVTMSKSLFSKKCFAMLKKQASGCVNLWERLFSSPVGWDVSFFLLWDIFRLNCFLPLAQATDFAHAHWLGMTCLSFFCDQCEETGFFFTACDLGGTWSKCSISSQTWITLNTSGIRLALKWPEEPNWWKPSRLHPMTAWASFPQGGRVPR